MVSTDSPSNLPPHEVPNPAAVIEELMFVSPTTQPEHRRVGGKAVTILPRPAPTTPIKQSTPSPPSNGQALAATQAQAIAASQPISSASAHQIQQQPATIPTMKCQTNKLGSRKMTHEIEEEVLANWGEHVTEYYEGIRRRVFKKIALKLNEMLQEEPFYTEKQVENKITYMEKRYKSVKDKFHASGYGVDDLTERSMRTQVERMFPLFFKVHNIIGRRSAISSVVTAAAASTAAAAAEVNGQGLNGTDNPSAANRGRKRKRSSNGGPEIEVKPDDLLPTADPPVLDVPLLDDSDETGDIGADIIESDGSPRESGIKKRRKPNMLDSNKRTNKKTTKPASPKQAAASETVLKATVKQFETEERQRKEMLQVMRNELHLKQLQIDLEKKSAQEKAQMTKAVELRKLAELYANIDEKSRSKQLLDESYALLSKL